MNQIPEGATHRTELFGSTVFYKITGSRAFVWHNQQQRWHESVIDAAKLLSSPIPELMSDAVSVSSTDDELIEVTMPRLNDEYEYTRKDSARERWYRCMVVGFYRGEPVIRTEAGDFFCRPVGEYLYRCRIYRSQSANQATQSDLTLLQSIRDRRSCTINDFRYDARNRHLYFRGRLLVQLHEGSGFEVNTNVLKENPLPRIARLLKMLGVNAQIIGGHACLNGAKL